MTFDDIEDMGTNTPKPTPAPAKRGRPAGTIKPKTESKPRFRLNSIVIESIMPQLLELAFDLDPAACRSKATQLRIAAEILEMIENKKA